MRRRALLSLVPAVFGFAGCTQRSDGSETPGRSDVPKASSGTPAPTRGDETATATSSPSQRTTTTAAPTADSLLRASYRHRFHDDSFRIVSPDRDQFLFVRPPDEATGDPGTFELVLDGDRHDPVRSLAAPPLMPYVRSLYTVEEPSGWLAFDGPAVSVERGALSVDGSRYPLPDDVVSAAATAPDLTVESVSAPESVASGGTIELTVEIRNDGDREGRFLGGFQHSGLPKMLALEVEPGGTARGSVTYDAYPDGESMSFSLIHAGEGESYEVEIR